MPQPGEQQSFKVFAGPPLKAYMDHLWEHLLLALILSIPAYS